MSAKKPYIVSIHSHGGSFWEASGDHEIVSLTDDELQILNDKYQYEEIYSDRYVCIVPISKILDYAQINEKIEKEIDENRYDDEEIPEDEE